MLTPRNLFGDFNQVQAHRLGIAPGQKETGAFALFGADGTPIKYSATQAFLPLYHL